MALGNLMATRFSYTSPSPSSSSSPVTAATFVPNHHYHQLPNHLDELPSVNDGDREGAESCARDLEGASCEGSIVVAATTTTNMAYLPQTVVMCEPRHEAFDESCPSSSSAATSLPTDGGLGSRWRPKERMRTGCVALVLCLNINVDPPDVIKISPCARMECWIDPFSMVAPKALDEIGKILHAQYERWQPRARYKLQLDPTVEEVKKLCVNCRKNAKSERVLFHYNGHGVPKPTSNGEIWVFNKSYTQYIPLPISDLDSWLKTPSIYVFDCSAAGMIVNAFIDWISSGATSSSPKDCILLAACQAHETLPQSAEFPADVFTSCLTTPIKMALRWFCSRSLLRDCLDHDLIDQIPGRQNDRKTLLGELNWIFTAVTDTIAWNVLPHELFQRLFRQDLLVASLFRNFLLAERIMRSANCSPVSHPSLPSTHQHHMWDAWDMAAEFCLTKLPSLIRDPNAEFQPSPFFTEQLAAFEVWLDHGSENKKPPEQLPIVLQVLLSQSHRFRALVLLGRFLDMGPWAVDLALSVGIFPYVLKLLQTTASELRNILVFIWTKILALDKVDLVKDGGHVYFIRFLDSAEAYPEQRAMAAFVLAVIVDGHRRGQEACIQENLIHVCLRHLQLANTNDGQAEPLLLQWLCLCLGKLWEDFPEAQLIGLQADASAICSSLLSEPQPEVRAAAIFALGNLVDVGCDLLQDGLRVDEDNDDDEKAKLELAIVKSFLDNVTDGSPLVRAEVVIALARFAFGHNTHLKSVAASYWKPQAKSLLSSFSSLGITSSLSSQQIAIPFVQLASSKTSQVSPAIKVIGDASMTSRDGRISSSSPLTSTGIMHGSPLSDNSSQHSDSGILYQETSSNGVIDYSVLRPLESAVYSRCVLSLYSLAKDPYPQVAKLGQRILSFIGIEQVVAKSSRLTGVSSRQGDAVGPSPSSTLAGIARSSSWFDMNAGPLPLSFRTPPVSPPRQNVLMGMRRVCSLEFRPQQLNSPDSGLANPILGSCMSMTKERSLLPQSTIYRWSCGHFSRSLLTAAEDSEELLAKRDSRELTALDRISKCQHSSVSKLGSQIANWDTKFETGTKSMLLLPFSPFVVAADQSEKIRIWNYEEGVPINSFENHNFPDKGISNLCLLNELDDTILLVASCKNDLSRKGSHSRTLHIDLGVEVNLNQFVLNVADGSIRIWKDFTLKGRQKLVTAFSSIQGHRPGIRSVNSVVDWQQQSGYLYASGGISSMMVWDLDKEQLINTIPLSSDSSISALSASQVHGGQVATGYEDGYIRLFDIRTPGMLVCMSRPHTQRVERVVGIGFQPGLDLSKVVSASQAGDIQFLDIRYPSTSYLTIDAHRGSLTALAIHRHAPVIASGSSKQLVKVFSSEGKLLSNIRYYPTFMGQRIGSINCLAFHPYRLLLAAGASDACVSIYAEDTSISR